jgi:hypothetical protein
MTIRLFVIWELLCGVYAVVELKDATLHLLSYKHGFAMHSIIYRCRKVYLEIVIV